jgi:hypothetical protein
LSVAVPALAQEPASTTPASRSFEERLRALEERMREGDAERDQLRQQLAQRVGDQKPKWFDQAVSLRGYGQFRYTSAARRGQHAEPQRARTDRSVNEPESLLPAARAV